MNSIGIISDSPHWKVVVVDVGTRRQLWMLNVETQLLQSRLKGRVELRGLKRPLHNDNCFPGGHCDKFQNSARQPE